MISAADHAYMRETEHRLTALESKLPHLAERQQAYALRATEQDRRVEAVQAEVRSIRLEVASRRAAKEERRELRRQASGLLTWATTVTLALGYLTGIIPEAKLHGVLCALGRVSSCALPH